MIKKISVGLAIENIPSNRSFGILFSFIFGLLLTYRLSTDAGFKECLFYLTVTIFLLLATFVKPNLLRPFNVAWFILGQTLGRLTSPIIWAIFFYFLITPIAVVTKIFGRDELRIKNQKLGSYWINRDSKLYNKDSFKNQF
ncbi:hypothetical protein IEN92_05200 [Polynucleobacter sp. MWH-Creno-3A4]|uniref:SxtJ family membrane protein n=1 Tax=Polynucleobacter sp. MWH-Creno-3A4 TaxID=1855886 RepID=UPI001C0BA4C1|nr:SxtJ family membrane protein [Polynucleobacter sp. MWH-Creno-3A4]MBU3606146.1 hypothetical protein [Polynucleobacter sp. MWH-Creno-3A4]